MYQKEPGKEFSAGVPVNDKITLLNRPGIFFFKRRASGKVGSKGVSDLQDNPLDSPRLPFYTWKLSESNRLVEKLKKQIAGKKLSEGVLRHGAALFIIGKDNPNYGRPAICTTWGDPGKEEVISSRKGICKGYWLQQQVVDNPHNSPWSLLRPPKNAARKNIE